MWKQKQNSCLPILFLEKSWSWANKYMKGDWEVRDCVGSLGIVLEENLAGDTGPWVPVWAPTCTVAAFGSAALWGEQKHLQLCSGPNGFYSLASLCMSQFAELLKHNKYNATRKKKPLQFCPSTPSMCSPCDCFLSCS